MIKIFQINMRSSQFDVITIINVYSNALITTTFLSVSYLHNTTLYIMLQTILLHTSGTIGNPSVTFTYHLNITNYSPQTLLITVSICIIHNSKRLVSFHQMTTPLPYCKYIKITSCL